jgi:hypothetical protein
MIVGKNQLKHDCRPRGIELKHRCVIVATCGEATRRPDGRTISQRIGQSRRQTMKPILLATAILLQAAGAHAGEVVPMAASVHSFRTGASVLIYFTKETDGYHVVATVQSDDTEAMTVFRFTTVLAPGQTAKISVPHAPGEAADAIVIRRIGDRLTVDPDDTVASVKPVDRL